MTAWLRDFVRAFAPYRDPIERLGLDAALLMALGVTLTGTSGWFMRVVAALILLVGLVMVWDLQKVLREFEADEAKRQERVRRIDDETR